MVQAVSDVGEPTNQIAVFKIAFCQDTFLVIPQFSKSRNHLQNKVGQRNVFWPKVTFPFRLKPSGPAEQYTV